MFQQRRKRRFMNHGASFPVSGFRSSGPDVFRVVSSTLELEANAGIEEGVAKGIGLGPTKGGSGSP